MNPFYLIISILIIAIHIITLISIGMLINYGMKILYNETNKIFNDVLIMIILIILNLYILTGVHYLNNIIQSNMVIPNIIKHVNNDYTLPSEIKSPLITSLILFSTQKILRNMIDDMSLIVGAY
jgi:hypothetical protein